MRLAFSSMLLLLVLSVLVACGGDGNGGGTPVAVPSEPVVITIGNLTDLTGPSAVGLSTINLALHDTAEYYSENELVPGVTFEVVDYDTLYDPTRYVSGYDALLGRGAEVFVTSIAEATADLKPVLERDRSILFTLTPLRAAIEPPGRVFGLGCSDIASYTYTLLDWIARNDPVFPADRPARIGVTVWNDAYGRELAQAAKQYVDSNSEQFEWVAGYLSELKFSWAEETEGLRDCDYIIPPLLMRNFVKEYAEAGYSTRYVGTDAHVAFTGQIDEADLWDEIDDMLFIQAGMWWTDEGELAELTRTLLSDYHPGDEQAIMRKGVGYAGVYNFWILFELLADTFEGVGPDAFTTDALTEMAESFTVTANGASHSFSATKRTSSDDLVVYRLDASRKDFFREAPGWIPIVREP